jgi:hypothetical protein
MSVFASLATRVSRKELPPHFRSLFVVFFLLFLVLFMDHFRVYHSRVTLLVIHKNEKTAAAADQVVETVAQLPQTLSFYEQLLSRYPEVSDPWKGYSAEDREALWREHVFATRTEHSNLVNVELVADSADDAASLARKVAAGVFQAVGRYYNVQTEIDVRLVNGPVTYASLDRPFGWFFLSLGLGILTGFGVASGVQRFGRMVPTLLGRRQEVSAKIQQMMKPEERDYIAAQHHIAPPATTSSPQLSKQKPEEVHHVEMPHASVSRLAFTLPASPVFEAPASSVEPQRPRAEKVIKTTKPAVVSGGAKSGAPANLPFLEDGVSLEQYLFSGQAAAGDAQEKKDEVALETEETKEHREPTDEELKRRLNQLLRGEL